MMKRFLLLIFLLSASQLWAQDVPLFTQGFTNTFIYNPSFAGIDYGSITVAHNRSWLNTAGSPVSNFVSINTPIPDTGLGLGISVLSDQINFYDNLFISGAASYHISINEESAISFGLSGEYYRVGVNTNEIFAQDISEAILNNLAANEDNFDLSVGASFRSKYFLLGLSANRLASSFATNELGLDLSQFYNAYARFMIPLRANKDILEPVLSYRNLSASGFQWSAGLYYTFNELITIGSSFRDTEVWGHSVGLNISNRIALGYTYESIGDGVFSNLNPTHEFVLRYDLLRTGYKYENASYKQQSKMALAFRRKAMLNSSKKFKKPRGLKKAKLRRMNPNKRFNQIKKRKKYKKKQRRRFKRRRRN